MTDKIMSVGKIIANWGVKAVKKTKEIGEINSLSNKLSEKEKKLSGLYRTVGEKYFLNSMNKSINNLDELVIEINNTINEIGILEYKINKLKGIILCDKCGEKNDIKTKFCAECGTKLFDNNLENKRE